MIVKPLSCLRVHKDHAQDFVCPPYDLFSQESAFEYGQAHPNSALHIILPCDCNKKLKSDKDAAYEYSRNKILNAKKNSILVKEDSPSFYLWQMSTEDHTQLGFVAQIPCESYRQKTIITHEKTREEKVVDRAQLIKELGLQTGVVELGFQSTDELDRLAKAALSSKPVMEAEVQGVQNTIYKVDDKEGIQAIQNAFSHVKNAVIADGHHRSMAALRVLDDMKSKGEDTRLAEDFLVVLVPENQLEVFSYKVKDGIPCAGEKLNTAEVLKGNTLLGPKSTWFWPKAASGFFFKEIR